MSKKTVIANINRLSNAIDCFNDAINEEIGKIVLSENYKDLVDANPADISARYWLMQFLEPLSRKELGSIVDGFLIQMLNDEQAKKLVKFLLARFPHYYQQELQQMLHGIENKPEEKQVEINKNVELALK